MNHNLSHHKGIQTLNIRSSTWPTVAWRRKRSLKGSQGNMEVVEKPNGHKLCAINYITFFWEMQTTSFRFSEIRPSDPCIHHVWYITRNRTMHFYIQSHFGIALILQFVHTHWVSIYSSSLQRHLCHICTSAFGFSWTNIWGFLCIGTCDYLLNIYLVILLLNCTGIFYLFAGEK